MEFSIAERPARKYGTVIAALRETAVSGKAIKCSGRQQLGAAYGAILKKEGLKVRRLYSSAEDATYGWCEPVE
jgi:2-keto-3-deoxy-galactonokinase